MAQIITRSEWGAKQPKSRPTRFADRDVAAIFLHHTTGATLGSDKSDDWVRNIQNFHLSKWNDIGYSFLYDAYGAVFEGRGWNVVGAHTPNWNSRAHAFAYLGDGNAEFPAGARDALRFLIAEHDRRFGTKPIKGHREAKSTDCPGDWIFNNRNNFRGGVILPGSPTPPAPAPTPTASAPAWPGGPYFDHPPVYRSPHVRTWQQQMQRRGWTIDVDGAYGKDSKAVARKFQTEKGLKIDGIVGPETWRSAWIAPVT